MGLKDISLENGYVGKGDKILRSFLLPSLSVSKYYDRITGFYSIESLLAISQGIESLFKNGGKMRLIIGIHSFPREMIDATLQREFFQQQIDKVRTELICGLSTLTDALEKQRLATLAWMIQDGLLEVKAASVRQVDNSTEIFHPKTIIISDDNGDTVAAIGSPNESRHGLGGNFEQLAVLMSWQSPSAVEGQIAFFESLWHNDNSDAIVLSISEDTAQIILDALGPEYINPKEKNTINQKGIISHLALMPSNFFVSGDIPALYTHQERAVIDALSRWPIRVLFADEVGLGKTFEAAATLVFLVKYCGVKRAVILTPKSVLYQWQEELNDHFGLDAWVYDSSARVYRDYHNNTVDMGQSSPLGKEAPGLVLLSAQFARGTGKTLDVFSYKDAVLPDVLIVDEAHSARVSIDISGKKNKTRMYQMLEKVCKKIPHLILATATPMQALFEAVVERYLEGYAGTVRKVLEDESLGMEEIIDRVLVEFRKAMDTYNNILQAENLHWTVQYALHDRTLETIAVPLSKTLARLKAQGMIQCSLPVDDGTLAMILLRGSEAVLHGKAQKDIRSALMEFWKSILSF